MDFKFYSLSIASLNVRGIRENTKRKALFLYFKRSDADIIFCQETHSTDLDVKFLEISMGQLYLFRSWNFTLSGSYGFVASI